jgi:prepilin signal peptidase PulO-like enzyme (type II secretory pathway)
VLRGCGSDHRRASKRAFLHLARDASYCGARVVDRVPRSLDFTIPDNAVAAISLWASHSGFLTVILPASRLPAALAGLLSTLPFLVGVSSNPRDLLRSRGWDGLGFGDVKLGAAGGILVGATGFSWALFGASLVAIGIMLGLQLQRKTLDASQRLAFGAILAPALWITWVVEQLPRLTLLDN